MNKIEDRSGPNTIGSRGNHLKWRFHTAVNLWVISGLMMGMGKRQDQSGPTNIGSRGNHFLERFCRCLRACSKVWWWVRGRTTVVQTLLAITVLLCPWHVKDFTGQGLILGMGKYKNSIWRKSGTSFFLNSPIIWFFFFCFQAWWWGSVHRLIKQLLTQTRLCASIETISHMLTETCLYTTIESRL